eukprot:IDg10227t1
MPSAPLYSADPSGSVASPSRTTARTGASIICARRGCTAV